MFVLSDLEHATIFRKPCQMHAELFLKVKKHNSFDNVKACNLAAYGSG
jgi:hypothetical protein